MREQRTLVRQWRLLQTLADLAGRGATREELASRFGVDERTILRDCQLWEQIGARIVAVATPRNAPHRFALAEPLRLPNLSFAGDEAFVVWQALHSQRQRAAEPFAELSGPALAKFEALLPPVARDLLADVDERTADVAACASAGPDEGAALLLVQALRERREVDLAYRSERATEAVTHVVRPVGLVERRRNGVRHLVSWEPERADAPIRRYKLARVAAADLRKERFEPPPDFVLADHLADTFGVLAGAGPPVRCVVRFAPAVRRYMEEHVFHPSQRLAPQPDGTTRATFELADFREFAAWLAGFFEHAEALEPPELRTLMVQRHAAAAKSYKSRTPRRGAKSP